MITSQGEFQIEDYIDEILEELHSRHIPAYRLIVDDYFRRISHNLPIFPLEELGIVEKTSKTKEKNLTKIKTRTTKR